MLEPRRVRFGRSAELDQRALLSKRRRSARLRHDRRVRIDRRRGKLQRCTVHRVRAHRPGDDPDRQARAGNGGRLGRGRPQRLLDILRSHRVGSDAGQRPRRRAQDGLFQHGHQCEHLQARLLCALCWLALAHAAAPLTTAAFGPFAESATAPAAEAAERPRALCAARSATAEPATAELPGALAAAAAAAEPAAPSFSSEPPARSATATPALAEPAATCTCSTTAGTAT